MSKGLFLAAALNLFSPETASGLEVAQLDAAERKKQHMQVITCVLKELDSVVPDEVLRWRDRKTFRDRKGSLEKISTSYEEAVPNKDLNKMIYGVIRGAIGDLSEIKDKSGKAIFEAPLKECINQVKKG